jgi:hypothetical protein
VVAVVVNDCGTGHRGRKECECGDEGLQEHHREMMRCNVPPETSFKFVFDNV